MTVIVKLDTGDAYTLDRRLSLAKVTEQVNEARGKGKLIPLELNLTPTGQFVHLDPDHIVSVLNDGYYY